MCVCVFCAGSGKSFEWRCFTLLSDLCVCVLFWILKKIVHQKTLQLELKEALVLS